MEEGSGGTPKLPESPWSRPGFEWNPEQPLESRRRLCEFVEGEALALSAYYEGGRILKRRWSRILRGGALGLTLVAGCVPLLKAALGAYWRDREVFAWTGDAGYLLFYLAAALVAVDKYAGFSSGWVRYWMTRFQIEKELEMFRLQWNGLVSGTPPPGKNGPPMDVDFFDLAKSFKQKLMGLVEAESKAWVQEFQNSLDTLESQVKSGQGKGGTKPAGGA